MSTRQSSEAGWRAELLATSAEGLAPGEALRRFGAQRHEIWGRYFCRLFPRNEKPGGVDKSYFWITWFDSKRLHQVFRNVAGGEDLGYFDLTTRRPDRWFPGSKKIVKQD